MNLHDDLLAHALRLSKLEPKTQTDADRRRAISAAYYALFHLITHELAHLFAADPGLTPTVRENLVRLIRRMVPHTELKATVNSFTPEHNLRKFAKETLGDQSPNVPNELAEFAKALVSMHAARERADYDASTLASQEMTPLYVRELVELAQDAFVKWSRIKSDPLAHSFLASLLLERLSRKGD